MNIKNNNNINEVNDDIPIQTRTKVYAFIFAFLALLADGADIIFLSFSYTSLVEEFGLTETQSRETVLRTR